LILNSFSTSIANSMVRSLEFRYADPCRRQRATESLCESMQEFIDTRNVSSRGGVVRSDQPVISCAKDILNSHGGIESLFLERM